MHATRELWDDSAEMAFGSWDNVMVKDLADDNICHLFYLGQNALVKSDQPYLSPTGTSVPAENFVQVMDALHDGSRSEASERASERARGWRAREWVL